MKRRFSIFLAIIIMLSLAACGSKEVENTPVSDTKAENPPSSESLVMQAGTEQEDAEGQKTVQEEETKTASKVLVAYYSATGTTKKVAETIAEHIGADIFEITPTEEYTDADLDWTNKDSRVSVEHDNPDSRHVELEAVSVDNFSEYDTVFIGYPIWWGSASWTVDDFVKENNFMGKTVIPFCTAASSDIGESGKLLAEMAGTGEWQEGIRFYSSASSDEINEWLEGLEY